MTRQVTHLDVSLGLYTQTACGKSLHGWNIYRPKNVTDDPKEVTCKNCLKKQLPSLPPLY